MDGFSGKKYKKIRRKEGRKSWKSVEGWLCFSTVLLRRRMEEEGHAFIWAYMAMGIDSMHGGVRGTI